MLTQQVSLIQKIMDQQKKKKNEHTPITGFPYKS